MNSLPESIACRPGPQIGLPHPYAYAAMTEMTEYRTAYRSAREDCPEAPWIAPAVLALLDNRRVSTARELAPAYGAYLAEREDATPWEIEDAGERAVEVEEMVRGFFVYGARMLRAAPGTVFRKDLVETSILDLFPDRRPFYVTFAEQPRHPFEAPLAGAYVVPDVRVMLRHEPSAEPMCLVGIVLREPEEADGPEAAFWPRFRHMNRVHGTLMDAGKNLGRSLWDVLPQHRASVVQAIEIGRQAARIGTMA